MAIHLEARIPRALYCGDALVHSMPPIVEFQYRIVRMLHAQLNACASQPAGAKR